MKTVAMLAAAAALAAPVGAYASCGLAPMWPEVGLSATPSPVSPGAAVTFRGTAWGIGEQCDPTVVLSVKGRPGAFGVHVGDAPVRPDGSFAVRWAVPAGEPLGTLKVVARQRCESGKDGSANQFQRTVSIRVWQPTA